MSLRTKMMLSIFAFMVLVLALLTLNLWLDAAARAKGEARRNADLLALMVDDWFGDAQGAGAGREWPALAERLSRSSLISGWLFVRRGAEGRLEPVLASGTEPARELAAEEALLEEALEKFHVDQMRARVYVPLRAVDGRPFAARLDLKGSAVPVHDIVDPMKGILTIMALGTALLLLNAYVITNRLVLRPLGTLVEASNRVAGGDFSKKIPDPGSYDEMSRMIGAFNLMIEKIAEHHRILQAEIVRVREQVTGTQRQLFAAQRLSTAGTLAAGIAHEINNPLGGMINAARALSEGRLDEAKRAEYLALVVDGLDRLRAIVQKILHLRPRPFEPRPVALRDAVEQAAAFLQHRAHAKGVEVRNELPPDLPRVDGDAVELQQAFLNLLMNAVDACVMGEGVVTVASRDAGGAVSVTVADNGCGMEEAELAGCMDPFFTTKDVGEGTGLGLSVAHNIVTNHGGRIGIESRRGQGTVVTLTFPALKIPAPAAKSS